MPSPNTFNSGLNDYNVFQNHEKFNHEDSILTVKRNFSFTSVEQIKSNFPDPEKNIADFSPDQNQKNLFEKKCEPKWNMNS